MIRNRRAIGWTAITWLIFATTVHSAQPKQADLDALRERLQALTRDAERAQESRNDARAQLAETEKKIAAAAKRIRRTGAERESNQRRLGDLQERKRAQQRELDGHRHALATQIRASYISGRQDYLKLLLNQEDPAEVGRVLTYYRYFDQARRDEIAEIDAQLNELTRIEAAIAEENRSLTKLSERLERERATLVAMQGERRGILADLDETLQDKSRQLERLREDERQLADLLKRLQRELADIPADVGADAAFSKLRGKLRWPTSGPRMVDFGAPRGSGQPNWQGVVIQADEGTDVRAVARGRVAFADWLYGYGMVLILDHGDGYMSLYAYNQSLVKDRGDWTEAGEVIALVGNSGGHKTPALYFEIRHNGKPDNPARWCAR